MEIRTTGATVIKNSSSIDEVGNREIVSFTTAHDMKNLGILEKRIES